MQHVVVKFVFFIPETNSTAAQIVHGGGNAEEVFEELGRDVFVNVIFTRELDRDAHQIQRKHCHPTRAIALFKVAAIGERGAAIEYADVIKPKEPAFENIFAFGIFPIHPPGKGEKQFVEDRFQKCAVAFTGLFALDLEDTPSRPPDHGWINIAEVPFVSGKLAVGMLIPFANDSIELAFGKVRIDQGEGNTMKGEVP